MEKMGCRRKLRPDGENSDNRAVAAANAAAVAANAVVVRCRYPLLLEDGAVDLAE
jgi:hypothetical protein